MDVLILGMDEQKPAGRINDQPAIDLAKSIEEIGFKMGRLKTGKLFYLIFILNY